ncbi:c-type cytochrome [Ignatzschineria larvae DSM 13226]|uniref:C-type cytochrome n=1 Tax=Ignatzschineria larvae DSM 13226 TaxID=1111732 RepID=A0ABZ3BYH0_9GAMM|nr:c-type cytochrome [Ignatzschineria larvae]
MQKQSDKFSFSLLTILATLALLVILIVLVTSFVKLIDRSIGGTPYENKDLVAERLKPYGRVNTGNLVADGPKVKAPQEIYVSLCASCHDTGLNDAPHMGDNAAWSVRFQERGLDGLHNSALHGRNLMPAKGGDPRLSDEEVIHTVDFILANSGIEVAASDPAEDIVAEEAPATAEVGETEAATEEKVDAAIVEQAAVEQEAIEKAVTDETKVDATQVEAPKSEAVEAVKTVANDAQPAGESATEEVKSVIEKVTKPVADHNDATEKTE